MPGSRSAALGIWVGVGNRDEPAPIAGVSHFLEHLLFKGTESRSARDIAEAVDGTGGDMNAYTSKEYTAFYLRVPARWLDDGLDLLCDVLSAPAFRPGDVDSERQVILEELHLSGDEPEDLVHTALYAAMYPDHALGWEIIGTQDSIATIDPDVLRRFHGEWYSPSNLVVAAAGAVDHDALVAGISARFGALASGPRPVRRSPVLPPARRGVLVRDHESAHLALGWRSLANDDADRYALAVANQIIGAGMSSRLFQEVRETRGLAYSVYSSNVAYADTGVFTVYTGTAPGRVDEVLRVVRGEIDTLVAAGVTARELDVAKRSFEGSTVLSLEDPGSRMARLGVAMTMRGRVTPVDEYLDAVRAVSLDDVTRVLGRVLGEAPTLVAVGDIADDIAW
jgi:predicted Zn-dependent peptidase